MSYAIITDTTCDLPQEYLDQNKIYTVPVQLMVGDKTYQDGELTKDIIYEALKKNTIKTSACLPKDALRVFDKVVEDGYQQALYISLGSNFSSMISTISLLKADYPYLSVKVLDSHGLSLLFGYLVKLAVERKKFLSISEMSDYLLEVREKMYCRCIVNDLTYPVASGRLNKVAGRLGTLMNIKPILAIEPTGDINVATTSRGYKKAYKRLIKDFNERFYQQRIVLVTLRGIDHDIEKKFISDIDKSIKIAEIYHGEAGVALSAHAGPDIFGYFAYVV